MNFKWEVWTSMTLKQSVVLIHDHYLYLSQLQRISQKVNTILSDTEQLIKLEKLNGLRLVSYKLQEHLMRLLLQSTSLQLMNQLHSLWTNLLTMEALQSPNTCFIEMMVIFLLLLYQLLLMLIKMNIKWQAWLQRRFTDLHMLLKINMERGTIHYLLQSKQLLYQTLLTCLKLIGIKVQKLP